MVRIHGQRHFLSRKASKHIGYWLSRARHILPLFFGNMAAGDVSIIAALPSLSQEEKKSLASPSLYISQSAVIRYFAVMAAARRFPAPDSSCCEGGKRWGNAILRQSSLSGNRITLQLLSPTPLLTFPGGFTSQLRQHFPFSAPSNAIPIIFGNWKRRCSWPNSNYSIYKYI